jgi:hypothetical protein
MVKALGASCLSRKRNLWRESLRVAREKRCLPDVVEGAEKHHYSLQPDSKTTMRRGTITVIVSIGRFEYQGEEKVCISAQIDSYITSYILPLSLFSWSTRFPRFKFDH